MPSRIDPTIWTDNGQTDLLPSEGLNATPLRHCTDLDGTREKCCGPQDLSRVDVHNHIYTLQTQALRPSDSDLPRYQEHNEV
jgi:hypothetical protein